MSDTKSWLTIIQIRFRRKRMKRFEALALKNSPRILDVGGTPEIWKLLATETPVVLINMPRAEEGPPPSSVNFVRVYGDGLSLPFADRSFDIVFSNSVIEHVGSAEEQKRFAHEVMRTGRGYWVQTPNRWFPVETHLLTPFVHFLPGRTRAFVANHLTVWQWVRRPRADEKRYFVEHFLHDIRLLSASELQHLFPDAIILRERFCLFTKSLIAWRPPA